MHNIPVGSAISTANGHATSRSKPGRATTAQVVINHLDVAEAAAPRNINEFILPPLALEVGAGPVMGYVSTMLRIQAAFEKARIQFTEEDESGGIGVRLQKKKRY